MIQRLQSLYLLGAAIFSALFFWVPIAWFHGTEQIFIFSATSICSIDVKSPVVLFETYPVAALAILTAFISLFTIFRFKNRMFQIRLNRLNVIVLAGFLVMLGVYIFRIVQMNPSFTFKPGIALLFPFFSIVLTLLAIRRIRSDEELVRSMDRIR